MRLIPPGWLLVLPNLIVVSLVGLMAPVTAQVGMPQRARGGMVASDQSIASEVGAQVMRRGGNAGENPTPTCRTLHTRETTT
ncbi:hypothetical protein LuPra_02675 [Luteitalea pratensis]|uniref:Uncharacterized protein n=1 Tax=Luteitalea pratensis TaxID=1855912 RepID=A0A143PMZ7_LUTPR|nr:hypothetical protein LuPra_02675 [Luteitalea pratensis]